MNPYTGKILIVGGLAIAVLGLFIYLAGDKLQWFGRLPGDIRIEKDNVRFFFPVTSLILISLLLNLVIFFAKKFWN